MIDSYKRRNKISTEEIVVLHCHNYTYDKTNLSTFNTPQNVFL